MTCFVDVNMLARRYIVYPMVSLLLLSCNANKPEQKKAPAPEVSIPVVTDERDDLILSWFADGGAPMASSVGAVPDGAKKEVRVQDPSVPPEKRDPSLVFIADLTAKGADGRYVVKTVKRAEWEKTRRAALDAARKKALSARAQQNPQVPPMALPPTPSGEAPVVMYATKHCPVCVKARRWLLEQKIPYIERDVASDAQAAAELQKKGAAQNVPVRGVPIFEIRGRLIPGFDPQAIVSLLGGGLQTQKTI